MYREYNLIDTPFDLRASIRHESDLVHNLDNFFPQKLKQFDLVKMLKQEKFRFLSYEPSASKFILCTERWLGVA